MPKYISFYDYLESMEGKEPIEKSAADWNEHHDLDLNLTVDQIIEYYEKYRNKTKLI